jgi:hypothetical protein
MESIRREYPHALRPHVTPQYLTIDSILAPQENEEGKKKVQQKSSNAKKSSFKFLNYHDALIESSKNLMYNEAAAWARRKA